jgi:hypothetical protein
MRRFSVPIFFLTAALVTMPGCTPAGPANTIKGLVTLNSKPVSGQVSFDVGGKTVTASTGPDGGYVLADPPLGKAKVTVKPGLGVITAGDPKTMKEKGMATGLENKGNLTAGATPPTKYASAETSGLEVEIKAGHQTFDIPLKE